MCSVESWLMTCLYVCNEYYHVMPLLTPPFFTVYLHLCTSEDLNMYCIILAWCVHGAWLFHTPSTTHKISVILSHIAIQLHKLVPSLWSAWTWVTQHVMPSPLQTQTLVEEQWEQWLQDKHIRSIFDKDSEIDWFCALRKDWTQSNVLFKAMYRRLFMIPVIPMCLWCS